ncbi:MAG TPA: ABC transporter substrate-binding protein, partial [bacterium]|nr:ABC transporter substrate-binding protein [bacterium]
IETLEAMEAFPEGIQHPQGPKRFVGRLHQSFGRPRISQVQNKRLRVVYTTTIEDGMYAPEADYTKQPL